MRNKCKISEKDETQCLSKIPENAPASVCRQNLMLQTVVSEYKKTSLK